MACGSRGGGRAELGLGRGAARAQRIGGSDRRPQRWCFPPTKAGLTNRAPSERKSVVSSPRRRSRRWERTVGLDVSTGAAQRKGQTNRAARTEGTGKLQCAGNGVGGDAERRPRRGAYFRPVPAVSVCVVSLCGAVGTAYPEITECVISSGTWAELESARFERGCRP